MYSNYIKDYQNSIITRQSNKIKMSYLNKYSTLEDVQRINKNKKRCIMSFSSVQFSHSVVSDSLRPYE